MKWNPKEAADPDASGLVRRTGSACEAAMLDEKANIFKVQFLHGMHGRIGDEHKQEGECALPGEICHRAIATNTERDWEAMTEVSRRHNRLFDRAEGLNVK